MLKHHCSCMEQSSSHANAAICYCCQSIASNCITYAPQTCLLAACSSAVTNRKQLTQTLKMSAFAWLLHSWCTSIRVALQAGRYLCFPADSLGLAVSMKHSIQLQAGRQQPGAPLSLTCCFPGHHAPWCGSWNIWWDAKVGRQYCFRLLQCCCWLCLSIRLRNPFTSLPGRILPFNLHQLLPLEKWAGHVKISCMTEFES